MSHDSLNTVVENLSFVVTIVFWIILACFVFLWIGSRYARSRGRVLRLPTFVFRFLRYLSRS
jgi:hypothetical protein